MSLRSEIPLTKEAKINGIAISLSKLINIVPNGFIQSFIRSDPNDV